MAANVAFDLGASSLPPPPPEEYYNDPNEYDHEYEMEIDEEEEAGDEIAPFEPVPFTGSLQTSHPTQPAIQETVAYNFVVDTPGGKRQVSIAPAKGSFESLFALPPPPPVPDMRSVESEEPHETARTDPHAYDLVMEDEGEEYEEEAPEYLQDDVLSSSSSSSAASSSSQRPSPLNTSAPPPEIQDPPQMDGYIAPESSRIIASSSQKSISRVKFAERPEYSPMVSRTTSQSPEDIPPPPLDTPPPLPAPVEVIDPSGNASKFDQDYIVDYRASRGFSSPTIAADPSFTSISSANTTLSSLYSPQRARQSNSSRFSMQSAPVLRHNVPSRVSMIVSKSVQTSSTNRRRETVLSSTFSEAVDFSPLTGTDFFVDMPLPSYGPFVQPPLLPPPGNTKNQGDGSDDAMDDDMETPEKFVFLYDHPMDAKPMDEGTFPEGGKFIVDLDMSRMRGLLTTTLLAPRATLLTDRCIPMLPPSLTALDLSNNQWITDACFSSLPDCLLHLDLRSATSVHDDELHSLPRNLQYLNLRSARHITSANLDKLPKTLVHLKLSGNNSKFKSEGLAKLPRMLKTLKIDFLHKMTKNSASQLPPRLKRLDLPRCLWFRDKAVAKLPRSITHLNLHSVTDMSSAALGLMPHALTWLDCTTMQISNDQHLATIPATMQTLHLTVSNYNFTTQPSMSKLTVLVLTGPLDEETPLPETLTALRYNCASNAPSSPQAFAASLPPALRILDVMGVPWDDESIACLPRGLFWLSIQASLLSSSCFSNFPVSLEYLSLVQMRVLFRSEELAHLPKTLKYLRLDAHPHNKALLKTCPRYFPDWTASTELAAAGETLFGPQDSCDGVGGTGDVGGISFATFASGGGSAGYAGLGSQATSSSGGGPAASISAGNPSGRLEDPNLWTEVGQPEIDAHEPAYGADGSFIHGAGYLYPFEHMDDFLIGVPWTQTSTKSRKKKKKRSAPDAWDPAHASMSPFDIHLVARKVARRSLLPIPSEKATRIETDMTDQDVTALDPNITELIAFAAQSITKDGLGSLPKDLTHLDMRSLANLKSSNDLLKLFRKRNDLTCVNLEKNNFKSNSKVPKIPKTLTCLDLSSSQISNDLVSVLPRSITYLALGCEKADFVVPSSLTALFLGNVQKVKASFVKQLPRTLVHLDFYSAQEIEQGAISALPKHTLRYLNLHCLPSLPDYSFSCIPRHLLYLSVSLAKEVSDRAIQALPRTLTHLDMSQTKVTCSGIACLPTRITHLSIDIAQNHDRIECIAYLPRGLKILNYGGDLKDPWFAFLPPKLTFLNLPFAFSMTPQFVSKLPESLLFFGAHSWARAVSDMPFSTPELIYLDLYNADLSHTNWSALPRSLKYISSGNLIFRTACAQNLPAYNPNADKALLETMFYNGDIEF